MGTSSAVVFFLNGRKVTIENPAPDLLLLDYLRSPDVGLTGAKKGCGQGGCGACTVVLSSWDEKSGVEHRAINSCLRPVCGLNGLAVTTVEGTGSTTTTMSEVAYQLAYNNGTQCGYCSVGFVMSMTGFLVSQPHGKPTELEIQGALDGNICRCTGYRPILTGMKTFASNHSKEDLQGRTPFVIDPAFEPHHVAKRVEIDFPEGAHEPVPPLNVARDGYTWRTASDLAEVLALLADSPRDGGTRLVCGNTSIGIYDRWTENPHTLIDVTRVPELHGITIEKDALVAGAATTYTALIDRLDVLIEKLAKPRRKRLEAVRYMARRTAGTIVRNAASLAGNSMLELKHIHHGEPFPSDMFTALLTVGATMRVAAPGWAAPREMSPEKLIEATLADPAYPDDKVILSYRIPFGDAADQVLAQKTALREVNSHSIVNSGVRIAVGADLSVSDAVVVFGGIAPFAFRAARVEAALRAGRLGLDAMPRLLAAVDADVKEQQQQWRARMSALIDEGFTEEYRRQLAGAFIYKFVVHALDDLAPGSVPQPDRSAGEMTWEKRPVSTGTEDWAVDPQHPDTPPLGQAYIKLEAFQQAAGEITYTHEIAIPPRGVNGALVLSKRALASFEYCRPGKPDQTCGAADLAAALRMKFPAFVDLVTVADVPGSNLAGMASDQQLLADGMVFYYGQAIAVAVAQTEQQAIEIAYFVRDECIAYGPLRTTDPWYGATPILGIDQALEAKPISIFPDCPTTAVWYSHVWRVTRPGSDLTWVSDRAPTDKTLLTRGANVDGRKCVVVEGTQTAGGQIHFYMETQAAVAVPDAGGGIKLYPSSQSPLEMHNTVCGALGLPQNKVMVEVRQLGGGYGGKTEPAKFVSGVAAIAAHKLNRIVRLVLPRADDSAMTGKRHPYYGQYQVAIDPGEDDAKNTGLLRGWNANLWGDGGATYDCSFIVSNCIQLRADNAYYVPNFQSQIDVCRTNTASNTAMRAFGDIQGMLIAETALDHAAVAIGLTAEDVRERNLYSLGQATPFGQPLMYCYIRNVWDWAKQRSDFTQRRAAVDAFNAANRWRKRGITLVPVKYGSGYNLASLEQASAFVAVYEVDATVVIRQSGVEMGQGLITKMAQIAAVELDIPVQLIDVQKPDTSVTPNPSSTGASTGTQYNGLAVRAACGELRERLRRFAHELFKVNGADWCEKNGVDYWNAADGSWKSTATKANAPAKGNTYWANLVGQAYNARVNLIVGANAKAPGGTDAIPNVTFKPMDQQPSLKGITVADVPSAAGEVDQFSGFTYSAACSEVEIDVLTGEVTVLRADIVYDMGVSMNPAVDVGQIEGAFVQGMGYVLTEAMPYQSDPARDDFGRLNADNTWRYKPPAMTSIPIELNVHLFPRSSVIPLDPNDLFSSKEVGEPPLVLATSVFMAVKNAIRASRVDRGLSPVFDLSAPATVQEVRRAADVHLSAV